MPTVVAPAADPLRPAGAPVDSSQFDAHEYKNAKSRMIELALYYRRSASLRCHKLDMVIANVERGGRIQWKFPKGLSEDEFMDSLPDRPVPAQV